MLSGYEVEDQDRTGPFSTFNLNSLYNLLKTNTTSNNHLSIFQLFYA
jgi:hypothetical protein